MASEPLSWETISDSLRVQVYQINAVMINVKMQECWIRKLRRDVLEGRLGTETSDPNSCAFASIISQCDVLEMSRAERVGNCAKCTYFGTQSQAS